MGQIRKAAGKAARSDSGSRPGGLVSARVADRILARIASGEWGPGHRLPGERLLAEEMGVSRVSVRAAMQGLKTQGLLDAVQGGGTRVIASSAAMDPGMQELVRVNCENLTDLAEIRSILEVWAVGRAASRHTDADIAELDEARIDAGAAQIADKLPHVATQGDVDAGCRLVEKQHLGLVRERFGDQHAPFHAAGQGDDLALLFFPQGEIAQ